MARPVKQGLDYFPHDTNASSDEKIEPLIILYGAKGYAFYFMHLEYIYRNPDLMLDISDADIKQIFCRKLAINMQEYDSILNSCLKHGCFCKDIYEKTGKLSSNGINKRASIVLDKRERMRVLYDSKRGISAAETIAETPQSKEKESKEKESNTTRATDTINQGVCHKEEVEVPQENDKSFLSFKNTIKTSPNKVAVLVEAFKLWHHDAPAEEFEHDYLYGYIGSMLKRCKDYGYLLTIIHNTESASINGRHLDYINSIIIKKNKQDKQIIVQRQINKGKSLSDIPNAEEILKGD